MAAADHTHLHPSALDAYPIPDRLRKRLLRFVRVDDGCWRWAGGSRIRGGYVQVRHGSGPKQLAHRLVYSHAVAPIPEGMQLDHLCRVTDCCRPDHLEVVTAAENLRRRDDARRKRETEQQAEVDYWRTRALRAEALLCLVQHPQAELRSPERWFVACGGVVMGDLWEDDGTACTPCRGCTPCPVASKPAGPVPVEVSGLKSPLARHASANRGGSAPSDQHRNEEPA